MSKNDENFIAFCNELRAYVEEDHLFPDKHCRMCHKIKYTRKKIKAGSLEIACSCVLFNGKWGPNYESLPEIFKIRANQDRHFSARVGITKDGEWGQKCCLLYQ